MTRPMVAGWLLVFSIWTSVAFAGDSSTFAFRCASPVAGQSAGKAPTIRLGATPSKEQVRIGQWNVSAAMTLDATADGPARSVSLKSYHVESSNMFLGLESEPGAPKKVYLAFWLPTAIGSMTDGSFSAGPYTDLTLYQDDGETKDLVYSGIPLGCEWSSVAKPISFLAPLGKDFTDFARSIGWPSDSP